MGQTIVIGVSGEQFGRIAALEFIAFDQLSECEQGSVDAGGIATGEKGADILNQGGPAGRKVEQNQQADGFSQDAFDGRSMGHGKRGKNMGANASTRSIG